MVLKRTHKHVPTDTICANCSMNNLQFVKVGPKRKKTFLRFEYSKMVIIIMALLFNDQVKDDVSTVQRTEAKVVGI